MERGGGGGGLYDDAWWCVLHGERSFKRPLSRYRCSAMIIGWHRCRFRQINARASNYAKQRLISRACKLIRLIWDGNARRRARSGQNKSAATWWRGKIDGGAAKSAMLSAAARYRKTGASQIYLSKRIHNNPGQCLKVSLTSWDHSLLSLRFNFLAHTSCVLACIMPYNPTLDSLGKWCIGRAAAAL